MWTLDYSMTFFWSILPVSTSRKTAYIQVVDLTLVQFRMAEKLSRRIEEGISQSKNSLTRLRLWKDERIEATREEDVVRWKQLVFSRKAGHVDSRMEWKGSVDDATNVTSLQYLLPSHPSFVFKSIVYLRENHLATWQFSLTKLREIPLTGTLTFRNSNFPTAN